MKVLFRVAVAILILFECENRRWLQQEVTVFNLKQRIARFCQQPTFSPARLLKVQKTPCHLIFIYIYIYICVYLCTADVVQNGFSRCSIPADLC